MPYSAKSTDNSQIRYNLYYLGKNVFDFIQIPQGPFVNTCSISFEEKQVNSLVDCNNFSFSTITKDLQQFSEISTRISFWSNADLLKQEEARFLPHSSLCNFGTGSIIAYKTEHESWIQQLYSTGFQIYQGLSNYQLILNQLCFAENKLLDFCHILL